jgi:hypothetical protein
MGKGLLTNLFGLSGDLVDSIEIVVVNSQRKAQLLTVFSLYFE